MQRAIASKVEEHATLVRMMLEEGEKIAANTLVSALHAENEDGKSWDVRVKAANSLLDRAGRRGAVAEKVAEKQPKGQMRWEGDSQEAVRRALRDPAVRQWLKENNRQLEMPPEDVPSEIVPEMEVGELDSDQTALVVGS